MCLWVRARCPCLPLVLSSPSLSPGACVLMVCMVSLTRAHGRALPECMVCGHWLLEVVCALRVTCADARTCEVVGFGPHTKTIIVRLEPARACCFLCAPCV